MSKQKSKFKKVHEKGYYPFYYNSTKIDNQSVTIFFGIVEDYVDEKDHKQTHKYNIGLAIGATRRQLIRWYNQENKLINGSVTGRIGLKGLVWAKNQLLEIERFIVKTDTKCDDAYIYIEGSDERRKRAYRDYLKRFGYEEHEKGIYKYVIVDRKSNLL
jgi:hypothetical protein